MKQKPLVSILLPVYKSQDYLSDCLQSLLSQTYKNLEIIAIDDNSSDASYRILRSFAKTDKRVRTYRNKKRYGIAVSLNRAVRRARGRFIAFMNHNDIASKERINQQIKFLLNNPKIAGVGTQARYLDKNQKRIGKSSFPLVHQGLRETLLAGLSLQPETVVLNRSLLPIDILKFKSNQYPFVYTEVFIKCIQYALFANLNTYLYFHRKTNFTTPGRTQIIPMLIKSWIKATTLDYTPSIRALLLPFLTPRSA
ncbi:MAG: hypothetical protein A3F31_00515 [Candidatus Levybacteria bacterium RIFCSPHIGHO2_12_FULL_38_12]|nr:MAG: hypothetical protein A3F31_00515 [Candidatus Levybacteria bacterium RIFCSPHIGHO2_12_FULL_38_12]OGH34447.1 MAG: hypothetical protein A3A47_00645 [Candidatus Levybacteria bacterium RIFCSPLOWO2_01_FULL_37_20]OGH44695.1 MAG: hypothetical protein A3J14_00005 [Candidatus Levybacteria bacterium RIFCSPLOWO2_02_FULL_37_18]OGH51814.1 MAG: hypothetical protein A3G13_00645 [Candidatus Levybacteria bacterium RIFCSPLOWO2_12_FULL_37_7]